MPFFVQFTKVKQKIELYKKSKENFDSLSLDSRFKILNHEIKKAKI